MCVLFLAGGWVVLDLFFQNGEGSGGPAEKAGSSAEEWGEQALFWGGFTEKG